MKIDLGCSIYTQSGYLGIDILRVPGVGLLADARKMPFADSSIEEVYSSHCIEHIDDQLAVISELCRICEPSALIYIIVPHFSNPSYYDDLTHCHHYSTRSFEHYDQRVQEANGHPNYLPEVNLKLESVRMNYWPERTIIRKSFLKGLILRVLNRVLSAMANTNHFVCERFWCRWVGGFFEVEYKFKVIKEVKSGGSHSNT